MKATKETLRRAIRTFIQAFISTLATSYTVYFTGVVDFGDWAAIKPLVISVVMSALSAGVAAAMNMESTDNEVQ